MIMTFVFVFMSGIACGFAVAATMAARDFKKLSDVIDISNAQVERTQKAKTGDDE